MCFFAIKKYGKIKIAHKDIVCYKTLMYNMQSFWKYHQYYFDKLEPKLRLKNVCSDKEFVRIEEGYHSFSTEEKVMAEYEHWSYSYKNLIQMVKCIIPKGSRYYYDPDTSSYVSNQIIIKEVIEE